MVGGAVAIEHSTTVTTVAPQFQLELHTHRLNMIEANMIQGTRMALLESRMNLQQLQQHQNQETNFKLELPSIAAYNATAKPPRDDPLTCHCGLVPALKTVLAHGPDLGRMFFICPQNLSEQCSFFSWKSGKPAEV